LTGFQNVGDVNIFSTLVKQRLNNHFVQNWPHGNDNSNEVELRQPLGRHLFLINKTTV